jgi:hypothetical protein
MTDVRDSNAALTVTSVVFTDLPGQVLNPAHGTIGNIFDFEWAFDRPFSQPIVLLAGEGLCLRTQVVMPATHTWMYSYTMDWSER